MATPSYWFRRKRYGIGWGLSARWQGWLTVLTYLALLALGSWLTLPRHPIEMVLAVIVLSLVLIAVVMKTSEPPRWQWGDDSPGQ